MKRINKMISVMLLVVMMMANSTWSTFAEETENTAISYTSTFIPSLELSAEEIMDTMRNRTFFTAYLALEWMILDPGKETFDYCQRFLTEALFENSSFITGEGTDIVLYLKSKDSALLFNYDTLTHEVKYAPTVNLPDYLIQDTLSSASNGEVFINDKMVLYDVIMYINKKVGLK